MFSDVVSLVITNSDVERIQQPLARQSIHSRDVQAFRLSHPLPGPTFQSAHYRPSTTSCQSVPCATVPPKVGEIANRTVHRHRRPWMRHPQQSQLHPGLAGLTHRRITVLPAAASLRRPPHRCPSPTAATSPTLTRSPVSVSEPPACSCSPKGGCSAHRSGRSASPKAIRRYQATPPPCGSTDAGGQITRQQARAQAMGHQPTEESPLRVS